MSQAQTVNPIVTIRDFLAVRQDELSRIAAKVITPERIIKVALHAVSRNPLLLQCSPASIYQALTDAAQVGLEPGGPLQQAALVPYWNKKIGKYEAQFQPMFRGLIALARRSGEIVSIEAHVVFEKDKYNLEYGIEPKFSHAPCINGSRGGMIFVWAMARFKDGGHHLEVMIKSEVESIKQRVITRNGGPEKYYGPWVTDEGEMWRKTVVKRACKYLPQSVELATALEKDDGHEGETLDLVPSMAAAPELPEPLPVQSFQPAAQAPVQARTEEVKEALRKRGRPAKAAEAPPQTSAPASAPTQPKPSTTPTAIVSANVVIGPNDMGELPGFENQQEPPEEPPQQAPAAAPIAPAREALRQKPPEAAPNDDRVKFIDNLSTGTAGMMEEELERRCNTAMTKMTEQEVSLALRQCQMEGVSDLKRMRGVALRRFLIVCRDVCKE